ncbi:inversin-like [Haliotis asinina]|uniref:inversin-like n=1 Tax=Haliotis asinina TaxID=109174 RepID=UPI0035325C8E
MKRNVSSDIQRLNIQVNQSIDDQFYTNQTLAGLTQDLKTLNTSCFGMRKEIKELSTATYPGTTEASTDPSRNNTFPSAPVTTQDLQASTTDESEYLTPSKTVPPTPVTTQDSDHHATPSPAAGRDLYDASSRGDLERVKRILAEGDVDINYRGQWSRTPVMQAAWKGHRDVVEFLVGRGADVSLVDSNGNNVLHFACAGGDLETVKLILSMNVVNINSRGWYNKTPVMMALGSGHRDVVEFLVGRGADVSLVDRNGNNVLLWACIGGDLETVKLILSLNVGDVDINYKGWYSRTPVMQAAWKGHRDVVEFLVDRGADVSLVDSNGNNVLHFACAGGDLETVKLILSMNVVNINSRGWKNKTPVMWAAGSGHRDVVEFLVGGGADVSLVDRWGNNVLLWACIGGDLETVKLIMSMNVVDINARNNDGKTAADITRDWGRQRMLDLLVSRGAH